MVPLVCHPTGMVPLVWHPTCMVPLVWHALCLVCHPTCASSTLWAWLVNMEASCVKPSYMSSRATSHT